MTEENKNFEEEVEETIEAQLDDADAQEDFIDASAEIREALNDIKASFEQSVADIKAKLETVDLSKEKVQEYADELVKTAKEYSNKAAEAYKKFVEDPKTVEYYGKAKETVVKASDSVKTTVTAAYDKAMENESVKSTVDKVGASVKEFTDLASEKYTKFTHDTKVRSFVVGATEKAKGLFSLIKERLSEVKVGNEVKEEVKEEGKEE